MAFTASNAVRNSSVLATFTSVQAANSIDFNRIDDKVFILARNENDTAGMTATLSVKAGDFGMQNVLGTETVTIAYNNQMKIIGPLDSMRFKDSAGNVNINVSVAGSGTVSNVKLMVVNNP